MELEIVNKEGHCDMNEQEQIYTGMDIKEEYEKKIEEINAIDDYIVKLNMKLIVSKEKEKDMELNEVELRKKKMERVNKISEVLWGIVVICVIIIIVLLFF